MLLSNSGYDVPRMSESAGERTDDSGTAPGSASPTGRDGTDAPMVGSDAFHALAVLSLMASILARGIVPALPGIWPGTDRIIIAMEVAAALSSQLFAVGAIVALVGSLRPLLVSTYPAGLRVASIAVVSLVSLAVLFAVFDRRFTDAPALVMAGTALLFAGAVARVSVSLAHLRAPSLVLGVVAIAALFRLLAIALIDLLGSTSSAVLDAVLTILATSSVAADVVAVSVALAWLVLHRTGPPNVPRLVGIVLAAVVIIGVAQFGANPEADSPFIFAHRWLASLAQQPGAFPVAMVESLEAVRWPVVLVALFGGVRGRQLGAAVALALVAGRGLEAPLCSLALVLGSFAIVRQPPPDLRKMVR